MPTFLFAIPGIAFLLIGGLVMRRHPVVATMLFLMGIKLVKFGGAYAAIYAAQSR